MPTTQMSMPAMPDGMPNAPDVPDAPDAPGMPDAPNAPDVPDEDDEGEPVTPADVVPDTSFPGAPQGNEPPVSILGQLREAMNLSEA